MEEEEMLEGDENSNVVGHDSNIKGKEDIEENLGLDLAGVGTRQEKIMEESKKDTDKMSGLILRNAGRKQGEEREDIESGFVQESNATDKEEVDGMEKISDGMVVYGGLSKRTEIDGVGVSLVGVVPEKLFVNSARQPGMMSGSGELMTGVEEEEEEKDQTPLEVRQTTSDKATSLLSVSSAMARKAKGRKRTNRNQEKCHPSDPRKIFGDSKDLFECSICALTFTSTAFLNVHTYKLHELSAGTGEDASLPECDSLSEDKKKGADVCSDSEVMRGDEITGKSKVNAMGNKEIESKVNATGNKEIESKVNATGNKEIESQVNATGNKEIESKVNATGNKEVESKVNATGNKEIESKVNAMGNKEIESKVNATGNKEIESQVNATGNKEIESQVNATGNKEIESKVNATGNKEIESKNGGQCSSQRKKMNSHGFNLRKRKEPVVKRMRISRRNVDLSGECSTPRRENTMLCDVCYDKFRCGDLKHWHMQIHSENEVLKCDGCGQEFGETSVIYTHTSQASLLSRDKHVRAVTQSDYNSENEDVGSMTTTRRVCGSSSNENKCVICDICGKSFGKKRDYQRHKRVHTGEKPYVCGECGKGFSDGGSFNKHKRIHTGEKPFHCGVCDKAFNRKWDVNRHMSVHTGAKPFPCYICGKSFSRKYEQEKHIKFHTGSAKDLPFICPICRKAYRVNSDLQKHLKTHSDDRPFQCTFCDKAFIIRRDLQRHVRSHTGEKPYVCSVCGKRFRDTSAYAQHKRIHSGIRPFKCPHCSKGFVKKDDLKRHVRVHTGERPYVCSHCGKAFGKNHDLKRHTRMHTGERPYKCVVCSKAFMRSSNLHTHMNIHTGEKPYKCTICTQAFKGSGDLYRHMKSHEKDKPHKCSICPQSFSRASDLDRHMEIHFGKRSFESHQPEEGFDPISDVRNLAQVSGRDNHVFSFGDDNTGSRKKSQGGGTPVSFSFSNERLVGNYSVDSLPTSDFVHLFQENGFRSESNKNNNDDKSNNNNNNINNNNNNNNNNQTVIDFQTMHLGVGEMSAGVGVVNCMNSHLVDSHVVGDGYTSRGILSCDTDGNRLAQRQFMEQLKVPHLPVINNNMLPLSLSCPAVTLNVSDQLSSDQQVRLDSLRESHNFNSNNNNNNNNNNNTMEDKMAARCHDNINARLLTDIAVGRDRSALFNSGSGSGRLTHEDNGRCVTITSNINPTNVVRPEIHLNPSLLDVVASAANIDRPAIGPDHAVLSDVFYDKKQTNIGLSGVVDNGGLFQTEASGKPSHNLVNADRRYL